MHQMLFVNSSDWYAIIYACKAILCLKYKAMLASISSFTMFTSETHLYVPRLRRLAERNWSWKIWARLTPLGILQAKTIELLWVRYLKQKATMLLNSQLIKFAFTRSFIVSHSNETEQIIVNHPLKFQRLISHLRPLINISSARMFLLNLYWISEFSVRGEKKLCLTFYKMQSRRSAYYLPRGLNRF